MVENKGSEPLHWLAETKFHPPLLRDDLVPRRHLLDTLSSEITSNSLTLISAPAGYGKTTLMAALPESHPELPVAWLSLDRDDNDPGRFLTALIVALQQVNPASGTTALSLLTGPVQKGTDVRRITSVLINDLLETLDHPFALILDDLHRISEAAIYVALDHLLEHRPPHLHLVASARVDPPLSLARLRARGELAELRLKELRFDDEETTTFLNSCLHLDLSAAEVDRLQSRTEGWPVGLRLLASSLYELTSAEERMSFVQQVAHSDRDIFDFLTEEVFRRQDAATRSFLLETAVLSQLTPSLCRSVTNRADAGSLLEKVYRRNLFLVQIAPTGHQAKSELRDGSQRPRLASPAETTETQYQYHDLFARFLRHKLEQLCPERLPELHLRAAQAEKDPVQAVAHYLAAASWTDAAELIERIGVDIFNRGYLDTLARWINALPASVRDTRPRLLHLLSNCAFWRGAWREGGSLLERALMGFRSAGDEKGQGEVLVDLATYAAAQGDLERCATLHSQALALPIPPHLRVQALLGRSLARASGKDWIQVEKDFSAAMDLVHKSAELDPLYLVALPYFHPGFAYLPGGLTHLEQFCHLARASVGEEVSLTRLMIEEMATILHLFRGRIADAIRDGERALALRKRLGGHPFLSLNAAMSLMIAYAACGEYSAVEPLFDVLFIGVVQEDQQLDLPIYLFYAGRVRWLQGRLPEAREIYTQMTTVAEKGEQRGPFEVRICLSWMRSLLALADGNMRLAESILRQPDVLEQKDRDSTMHGISRLMLARLFWRQGRQQEALAELGPVLAYHEQLGIPFAILVEGQSIVPLLRQAVAQKIHESYAAHLLQVLGAAEYPHPVAVAATGATLTAREAEVLGLVVTGLSNRAIADELMISEWTVKSHLTKVYRKLGVASRTQAIVHARELGFS